MKNLLISAALIFTTSNAFSKDLEVRVKQSDDNKISIQWHTQKVYTSICSMKVQNLNLKAVSRNLAGDLSRGKIAIAASVDAGQYCLQANGPHNGQVTLELGNYLPQISHGEYDLEINDEVYGKLVVGETVELINSDDLDEPSIITLEGRIETGIVAIGGETTGVVIYSASHGPVEIQLGDYADEDLNGKLVRVKGTFMEVVGVEIPFRRIFVVEDLEVLEK